MTQPHNVQPHNVQPHNVQPHNVQPHNVQPHNVQPADVQAAFSATLVDEWVRSGVTDAVVAPGSRSTPVLAALAADGRIRLHVVLDERSAGYVALGLGLASGVPAPVVTTSGTASVELHPALVEADLAGVPMLAVTADRPPELHGVGAPQTVAQDNLYAGITRWEVAPGVPDATAIESWRSLGSRLVAAAVGAPGGPGPVHVNLAFREPLLGDPTAVAVPAGRADGRPWHRMAPAVAPRADLEVVELLASRAGRRGLIVAGGGAGDPDTVLALGRRLGWPILADPRSGCRLASNGVIGAADALLRAAPVRDWTPEVVLRLGRPAASKVLGQWLAALPPEAPQILVDPDAAWADPDRRVAVVSRAAPDELAAEVLAVLDPDPDPDPDLDPDLDLDLDPEPAGERAPESSGEVGATPNPESAVEVAAGQDVESAGGSWWRHWVRAEAVAQAALDEALAGDDGLGEAGVARRLYAGLGEDAVLVTSSSMPVRDVEWFGAPRSPLRVVANRGANGIDGVISTAIGVALAGHPTVALIGDLAFTYDVSALLWAAERDIDCTFVVVDNNGGGIFSFLPQATQLPAERFERLWGTPHGVDLLAIASAYGAATSSIESAADLDEVIASVGAGKGVRVARYRSDRASNVTDHDRLNAAVAKAVAGLEAVG
jgi:2-succinyl-5-enolpyruvyl-6-hydroxy-3-cyclohexene-1-carboxylate synthase